VNISTRIKNFIFGIVMLLCAVTLLYDHTLGYKIIIAILSLSFLIYGIRRLYYYLTMARYMVGGMAVLIKAVIILNLAFFVLKMSDIPKIYIMVYLVAGLMFTGVVDILRALEAKKHGSTKWKLKFSQGILTMLISVTALFFIESSSIIIYIFCIGLISSAITRLTEAFRKTAIIYIS